MDDFEVVGILIPPPEDEEVIDLGEDIGTEVEELRLLFENGEDKDADVSFEIDCDQDVIIIKRLLQNLLIAKMMFVVLLKSIPL